ncbi:MAG: sodium:melibiose symporter, partial [Puniceicoccaceae bacterium]
MMQASPENTPPEGLPSRIHHAKTTSALADAPESRHPNQAPLKAREKLSYGSGAIPFTLAYAALANLAFPIFNITLGLSATLIGIALAIGRLWDAFTDPVMGMISDNARTRWGRRRPFILLGGLLCGLTFPLFWFLPTGWGEPAQFAWIVLCILLFYSATTVYSVPWLSLGYELNPDPLERTRLQAWRTYLAAGASLALPWIYRGAQADGFGDTIVGMRWLGLACGLAFILFAWPVFLGCRERVDATTLARLKTPLIQGLRETCANRAFLILVGGIVTTMLCAPMLVGSLDIYINNYHIFDGDTRRGAAYAATFGTIFFLLQLIFVPLALRLTARFGKITVIRASL